MANNPMQQFTVHKIGPEINIAGVDLSFTNASLFMVISASLIILLLFVGSKEKKIIITDVFFISIFLEITHFFIPIRAFEIKDLFGNLIGVIISLIIFNSFNFWRKKYGLF